MRPGFFRGRLDAGPQCHYLEVMHDWIRTRLEELARQELLRSPADSDLHQLAAPGGAWLDACSNDYLGLGRRSVSRETLEALVGARLGAGASRLVQGSFSEHRELEHELDRYLLKSRMTMIKLPASMIKTGPVVVQGMTAGASAVMPVIIRSRRGVDREMAKAVLADARAIASRFPKDAAVLSALAEAEHDAGNDKEAVAAADAALAVDPRQVNAYVQKGLSLYRIAQDAPDRDESYKEARAPFTALNRIENDHPLPLFYYYDSFVRQGKTPSSLAIQALERASELAPFDLGLRMTLAMQQLRVGDRKQARRNLLPVAYNPHGGNMAEFASKTLERMDKEPNWDGSDMPVPASDNAIAAGP